MHKSTRWTKVSARDLALFYFDVNDTTFPYTSQLDVCTTHTTWNVLESISGIHTIQFDRSNPQLRLHRPQTQSLSVLTYPWTPTQIWLRFARTVQSDIDKSRKRSHDSARQGLVYLLLFSVPSFCFVSSPEACSMWVPNF